MLPSHAVNPFTMDDRAAILKLIDQCDKIQPACEAMGQCGITMNEQIDTCINMRESLQRILDTFFGK